MPSSFHANLFALAHARCPSSYCDCTMVQGDRWAGRCSWRCAHGMGYLLTQWLTSLLSFRSRLSRRWCAARITARRASSFMACS